MRLVRSFSIALAACLLAASAQPTTAAAAPAVPTLVGIRAAHHPGFDRIVFEFRGGLPTDRHVRYVDRLLGDASGRPVRIAGRAVLSVSFAPARAHNAQGPTAPVRKAFALPNIMTTVQAGDFESVMTYGVGLAKQTPFQVSTLTNPSRVVIDIQAAFRTVDRKVFFFIRDNFVSNIQPFFTATVRPVLPQSPATGVLDRLFAGPVAAERTAGLRLLRSHARGFAHLAIADKIARIRLTGGCNSNGSTVTVAGEIMPTLRQFRSVDWVKILDRTGSTQDPTGPSDSIPVCLEP